MLQHQSESKIDLTIDGLWGTAWVGIQLNLQPWVLVINKVQAEIGFNPASQCNAGSWADLYGWIMLNTLLTMLVVLVRPHPCQWCPSCPWHSVSSWWFEVARVRKFMSIWCRIEEIANGASVPEGERSKFEAKLSLFRWRGVAVVSATILLFLALCGACVTLIGMGRCPGGIHTCHGCLHI